MPILVRPVREQLEHDRIIRLLQARHLRKHDPVINVGNEPPTSVVIGTAEFVPDVILVTNDKARKLEGVIEVETGESVNSLEALAQWVPFSRLRVPFHLYVPPNTLDTVRRLCRDHNVTVTELWTYHTNLDQVRFTLIQKAPDSAIAAARKAGLVGTPKLKVAPPPPPPPPPPPTRASDAKAPVRTAAQKAFGKFVAAANKASAAKQGAVVAPPPAAPATKKPVAGAPAGAPAAKAATPAKAVASAKPVAAPKPAVPAKATGPAKAPALVKSAAKPVATKPAAPKPAAKPVAAAKPAARPAAKAAAKAPVKTAARKAAPAKAVPRPAGKRR